MLIPFIVIIGTVSNLIRPVTPAVRQTANMIAGRLLLTLLGNNGPSINHTLLTILITAQILLLISEAAVAIIQSYVFAVLRTLYCREVNVSTRISPIPHSKQKAMTTQWSYWSNSYINLLKPSGFFTYHKVEHSKIVHGARFALSVLCGYQKRHH